MPRTPTVTVKVPLKRRPDTAPRPNYLQLSVVFFIVVAAIGPATGVQGIFDVLLKRGLFSAYADNWNGTATTNSSSSGSSNVTHPTPCPIPRQMLGKRADIALSALNLCGLFSGYILDALGGHRTAVVGMLVWTVATCISGIAPASGDFWTVSMIIACFAGNTSFLALLLHHTPVACGNNSLSATFWNGVVSAVRISLAVAMNFPITYYFGIEALELSELYLIYGGVIGGASLLGLMCCFRQPKQAGGGGGAADKLESSFQDFEWRSEGHPSTDALDRLNSPENKKQQQQQQEQEPSPREEEHDVSDDHEDEDEEKYQRRGLINASASPSPDLSKNNSSSNNDESQLGYGTISDPDLPLRGSGGASSQEEDSCSAWLSDQKDKLQRAFSEVFFTADFWSSTLHNTMIVTAGYFLLTNLHRLALARSATFDEATMFEKASTLVMAGVGPTIFLPGAVLRRLGVRLGLLVIVAASTVIFWAMCACWSFGRADSVAELWIGSVLLYIWRIWATAAANQFMTNVFPQELQGVAFGMSFTVCGACSLPLGGHVLPNIVNHWSAADPMSTERFQWIFLGGAIMLLLIEAFFLSQISKMKYVSGDKMVLSFGASGLSHKEKAFVVERLSSLSNSAN